MSLAVIFDAAKPVLIAAANRDGGQPPTVKLGEENLPNPRSLPAIVWVPRGGPVVSPRQQGSTSTMNPRQLWTRQETVHMYVYTGSGYLETEELVQQIVAALVPVLSLWSFRVSALAWSHGWPVVTSDEPVAALSSGTLCVVSCEFMIPLVAFTQPVAVPTHKTITGSFVDP